MEFKKNSLHFLYFGILLASVSVPFLLVRLIFQGSTRYVSFFSSFAILGFIGFCIIIKFIISFISKSANAEITPFSVKGNMNKWLKISSIYFVIFFSFQVGFISEVTLGYSNSIALSNNLEYDYPRYNEQEILSANWICSTKNKDPILVDEYRNLLLKSFDWNLKTTSYYASSKFYYIYLGTFNSWSHKFSGSYNIGVNKFKDLISLNELIYTKNKIYSNGKS